LKKGDFAGDISRLSSKRLFKMDKFDVKGFSSLGNAIAPLIYRFTCHEQFASNDLASCHLRKLITVDVGENA